MSITATRESTFVEILGGHYKVNAAGLVLDECQRCGLENGRISMYANINGGVCYACFGHGGSWVTVDELTATIAARIANEARLAANREKRAAALGRKIDRFIAANPSVAAIMDFDTAEKIGSIAIDLRLAVLKNGKLSEKQIALVSTLVERAATREARVAALKAADADRKAAADDAPTGRVEVTGEVVRVTSRENDFSYHAETVWSMCVRDDRGFEVWATIPRDLHFPANSNLTYTDNLKGHRVQFTATLTPKATDPKVANGKRPAKAVLLDA